MKKIVFALGMAAAAALSFSSCQKAEVCPAGMDQSGQAFEIVASAADTRTTNDGLSTKWSTSDELNVFHAVAGTTTYVNDTPYNSTTKTGAPFKVADAASGSFTGTLASQLQDGSSYDWYAFYPYSSYVTTPANTNNGYVTVGGTAQTQNGYDSKAHLAGSSMPLYGQAKAVPADETPTIAMKQICSVIEVTVTNANTTPLTVSNVAFTGTEDIVGTYYVNFAGDTPAFKGSGASYVSKTATLTVKNGTALANGEAAKFYIAVKPFSAAAGSAIKVSVNGYEKTINLSAAAAFASGKISKIGFAYDYEPSADTKFYKKVTSPRSDWSGKYLIVADKAAMAFSGFSSTSTVYGLGSAVTITDSKIESNDATDAIAVDISAASTSGKYIVKLGSTFLSWTSGNSLLGATSESDNSRWTIAYNGGSVLFTNVKDSSRELWWNVLNPRFACYTGKSAGADYYSTSLYRYDDGQQDEPVTYYGITLPVGLTGGSLKASAETAAAGELVTVTATLDEGYSVKTLTAGVSGETLEGTVLTFIMPEKDVTISAVFEKMSGFAAVGTSNVTLTKGTNASDCKVNGFSGLKIGTSSKGGDMSVTVPAGSTKLHVHAAAWNGVVELSLNITPAANVGTASIALTADANVAGNSTSFTLSKTIDNYYFEIPLSNITADTKITFTTSIAKRFVIWGVNAE